MAALLQYKRLLYRRDSNPGRSTRLRLTSVPAATDDCEQAGPLKLRPALEPLLLQHAVTTVVAGHVHNYERTTPVTNGSVAAEDSAPVHVTVGNAGDIEGMTRGWARVRPA